MSSSGEGTKLNPPNNLVFHGNANFVGREDDLGQLSEKLIKPSTGGILAVSGMAGVGKTELARQYARQYEANYPGGICWLSMRGANLAADIFKFAKSSMNLDVQKELKEKNLNLKDQILWFWANWKPVEGLVLIILDDVTDWTSCRGLLPTSNRFRILMTTRQRRLETSFAEISLDVLSEKDALKLLASVLVKEDLRVKRKSPEAKRLCAWLGYLPLGLELVGRYLVQDPDLSLTDVLTLLKTQSLQDNVIDLSEKVLQNTEMTAKRGVKAAFQLSWQELNPATQRVGELLSLFAPEQIFWTLVQSISKSLSWGESDVVEAKKQLYKFNLIQSLKDTNYKIHPLIREFLKVKLADSEQTNNLKQAFIKTLVESAQIILGSPSQEEDIKLVKNSIPHLAEVAEHLETMVIDKDLLWVFQGLGKFYSDQGLYESAKVWYEKCVSVLESRLGKEHLDVATSYNNLAVLYRNQGKYMEAENLYNEALNIYKRLSGDHNFNIATCNNNLGLVCLNQGKYNEAQLFYQQALKLKKHKLGENHIDIANCYDNLGIIYRYLGKYSEAELYFNQGLELSERLSIDGIFPKTQIDKIKAQIYNDLALLYLDKKQYKEAEDLIKKCLELTKQLYGENHIYTATNNNNLASLYHDQGRYTEAENLYQKALKVRKKMLGEDHPDVAITYSNLASLYHDQGKYTEAENLHTKALKIREPRLRQDHPDIAKSYNGLAEVYRKQRRYTDAKREYEKALTICKQQLGVDHPTTTQFQKNYNDFLKESNEN
ncbi:MAG: tetratricopeptide repeat protein [Nostoc sp. EfeVER01]|uniref:tetratricopeptide repeat protein n=1 Tax=unclassified Nostoc TaxID=2593658 RepID=UPI002AD37B6B|nr:MULTISPECIES: tetratricopeptide repeat protein [unclassified Nostoc]MDZ7946994.1 tetratricopeptide repeat protein [Nostoc sp. EfeVER01]MDZ7993145.1 tetratricopeptide repeat protein [Nostoc sp. EspVER01]